MFLGWSIAGSPPSLEELTEFPAGVVPARITATHTTVSDVSGVFIIEFVVIEGEAVPICVILKRWDASRYLVDIRARQSTTFAFIF